MATLLITSILISGLPTRATVHGLLEDLQLVVELCEQGALAEGAGDEATLQLVSDVVAGRDLLLGVSWLGQELGGVKEEGMKGTGEEESTKSERARERETRQEGHSMPSKGTYNSTYQLGAG